MTNGPPFNSREFAKFLCSLDHTTSSPHHPQSNGNQSNQMAPNTNEMVKTLPSKFKTQCFLYVLADIRNGSQSSAKILHGRNLATKKKATAIDHNTARTILQERQVKQSHSVL